MGDLEKLERNLPGRINQSRQKVLDAENRLRLAKVKLDYEEKSLKKYASVLRKDIEAIDIALSMHHIQINPQSIPSIHTPSANRATPYGEMTRHIFECLKEAKGRPLLTTEVALFVAIRSAPDLSDDEFQYFRHRVRHRLKELSREEKVLRLHKLDGSEGKWTLPRDPDQPRPEWRSRASLQDD